MEVSLSKDGIRGTDPVSNVLMLLAWAEFPKYSRGMSALALLRCSSPITMWMKWLSDAACRDLAAWLATRSEKPGTHGVSLPPGRLHRRLQAGPCARCNGFGDIFEEHGDRDRFRTV